LGADNGENFNDVSEALTGRKFERCMRMGSPLGATGPQDFVGRAVVEITVHEVGNDFDGALDVELFDRLIEQIARDGSDAVALLDGKRVIGDSCGCCRPG